MAVERYVTLDKSKFVGVIHYKQNGIEYFQAEKRHKYRRKHKACATEREAAITYDLFCIEFGLPPVNILKPK